MVPVRVWRHSSAAGGAPSHAGPPVDNDRIESVLGLVDGKPSRLRQRILRSNGITARHYALDAQGRTTELNEELAVTAIQAAVKRSALPLAAIEMLAAAS